MSDEQAESASHFQETASFATLESRPELPSFDTLPREWNNDTGLRLEGRLEESHLGVAKGQDVVVIFGPQSEGDPGRPIAVFEKHTGQKYSFGTPDDRYQITSNTDKVFSPSTGSVIREMAPITMVRAYRSEGNEEISFDSVFSLNVEKIKSGPLV